MKESIFEVVSNISLNESVYLLTVKGDTSEIKKPGQFCNLKLDGFYLRRPISDFDVIDDKIYFLYKILGDGTLSLSKYEAGHKISILTGLGNGFDMTRSKKPLLIGGGIGIAPLYQLAKEFKEINITPTIILGFKNKDEVILEDEFEKLGNVIIVTDNGSYSIKGNPVSYMKENKIDYDHYYACGPNVMLHFLTESFKEGEVSLEARMGCGFGACMGCSIITSKGNKRICKEGPVFLASEVTL